MHDIDIEVLLLPREQRRTKLDEFVWCDLQHGGAGLVHKRRRGMPRLDLLAEDEADFGGVLFAYGWEDGRREGVPHFGGEGADVVEVCFLREKVLVRIWLGIFWEGKGEEIQSSTVCTVCVKLPEEIACAANLGGRAMAMGWSVSCRYEGIECNWGDSLGSYLLAPSVR